MALPNSSQVAATAFFFFRSWSEWSTCQCFMWAGIIFALIEAMSWCSMLILENTTFKRIPAGGKPLDERDVIDIVFIGFNKLMTCVFVHHILSFCWNSTGHISWKLSEITLWNTVVALVADYLVFDFFYYWLHRILHFQSVYPYIHKHHHKQVVPTRGHDDAVNVHPFEFLSGEYCHLLAIFLIPNHMITVFIFIFLGGILATLNHTRYDIEVGPLYSVKAHDTHHRIPMTNYAQYTMFWDRVFGSYVPWSAPIQQPQRAGIIPKMCETSQCRQARSVALSSNDAPKQCVVTGACGLVGRRLVSMLVERGASRVMAIDINEPKEKSAIFGARVEYLQCDICDEEKLVKVFQGAEVVYHVAALVGPYFPKDAYMRVNYQGTVAVVNACKRAKVPKLVMTSSPTTRLDGSNVKDISIDEMKPPKKFLQEYAKTKAMGERILLDANSESLLTCALAPHQVYGPEDKLFLPSLLQSAMNKKLRIFGGGNNLISFTHVDNISHALILAGNCLKTPEVAPAGQFYVVTDGGAQYLWDAIDFAVTQCGFTSLKAKFHLSLVLLVPVAHVLEVLTSVTGIKFKLTPFTVRMLTIHRYFNIDKLCKDIQYKPIMSFEEGWQQAVLCAKQKLIKK